MELSLKETAKKFSQPRQCSDVLLLTRAVNYFHPSESYGEVLTTIINVIQGDAQEESTIESHDREDQRIVAWSSAYYDDPVTSDDEPSLEETNRYLTHTMSVLEQWNRERVMYLYDQRMLGSVRGKAYDNRLFARNDLIWLRNSPSLDTVIERLAALQNCQNV